LWQVRVSERKVFLTFDDGPVPGPTEFVLGELKRVGAKATFFCVGDNVSRYPDIYRKVLDAGHLAANHTFHHLDGWKHSLSHYLDNVRLCDEHLGAGSGARLFRPPYGKLTRAQRKALSGGYRIVMWDVLTADFDERLDKGACLRQSIRATRPGSIVVFHDSLKAEKNLRHVLPRYLDHLKGEGYSFDTIPAGNA
jgi:peptidoglycan/xylan/chitin deacetylase (PgdA/CDA1 family)